VGIGDQTGNFVLFVGNDGFLEELLERNVGECNPRRNHLLGALGGDPSQAVSGTRRRGFGQEIAKVLEDVGGGIYGMPIDHVRSGPSARCAEDRRKAYHLALRSATKPVGAIVGQVCRRRRALPCEHRPRHNHLIYLMN
jgi:hypothetical protein